jgi:hypothetical protein
MSTVERSVKIDLEPFAIETNAICPFCGTELEISGRQGGATREAPAWITLEVEYDCRHYAGIDSDESVATFKGLERELEERGEIVMSKDRFVEEAPAEAVKIEEAGRQGADGGKRRRFVLEARRKKEESLDRIEALGLRRQKLDHLTELTAGERDFEVICEIDTAVTAELRLVELQETVIRENGGELELRTFRIFYSDGSSIELKDETPEAARRRAIGKSVLGVCRSRIVKIEALD